LYYSYCELQISASSVLTPATFFPGSTPVYRPIKQADRPQKYKGDDII
jgi:hypothetical protein